MRVALTRGDLLRLLLSRPQGLPKRGILVRSEVAQDALG